MLVGLEDRPAEGTEQVGHRSRLEEEHRIDHVEEERHGLVEEHRMPGAVVVVGTALEGERHRAEEGSLEEDPIAVVVAEGILVEGNPGEGHRRAVEDIGSLEVADGRTVVRVEDEVKCFVVDMDYNLVVEVERLIFVSRVSSDDE